MKGIAQLGLSLVSSPLSSLDYAIPRGPQIYSRAIRWPGRHGSCGMGIGETMRRCPLWPGHVLGSIGAPGFVGQLRELKALKHAQAREFFEARLSTEDAVARIEQELLVLSSESELENTASVFETVGRCSDVRR